MRKALLSVIAGAVMCAVPAQAGAAAPPGPRLAVSSFNLHFPNSPKEKRNSFDLSDLLSGNVFTVDANGDSQQMLTDGSSSQKLLPLGGISWSPDGSSLALQASKLSEFGRSGASEIYVVGADGSGLRRLTRVRNASSPVYSADGKQVYFERTKNIKKDAFAGLKRVHLKKGFAGDLQNSVAVLLARISGSIWAINVDGTGLHRVTAPKAGISQAPTSVSPLTGDIAFSQTNCRRRSCTSSARLFSITTGTVTLIANHADSPAFSPDGQKVALDSYQDHNWRKHSGFGPAPELYVRTLATGEMRRLTFNKGIDGPASWDPSGSRLAYLHFNLSRNGVSEINPDGSCATPLPALQGMSLLGTTYQGLAWQPGQGRGAGPAVC